LKILRGIATAVGVENRDHIGQSPTDGLYHTVGTADRRHYQHMVADTKLNIFASITHEFHGFPPVVL
jgi:hypothetical protein